MWKFVCCLFAFSITAALGKSIDAGGRIIGGYATNIKDHPFVISIHDVSDNFVASGTLISPKWIITVAHTFTNYQSTDLFILANSSEALNGQKEPVANIVIHPNFQVDTLDRDVALIELDENLNCLYCSPIKISKVEPSVGEMVAILGWGQTTAENSNVFPTLQLVEVPVMNPTYCESTYASVGKTILDDTFCVGSNQGTIMGSCNGDQGGAVFTWGEGLEGIISIGDQCTNPDLPGVYTKVVYYLDWIKEITGVEPA